MPGGSTRLLRKGFSSIPHKSYSVLFYKFYLFSSVLSVLSVSICLICFYLPYLFTSVLI